MSHYNPSKFGSVSKPAPSENNSFERAVISNMKQSIEKHLSHVKIDQNQLNRALMISIDNFRLEEHTDECMLILLRHKANPNCIIDAETPLTAACKKGQQLLVKTLLDYGAKPDLPNEKGEHPLQIILFERRENYDVAFTLIQSLPTVNVEFRDKFPLVVAVEQEYAKIFQMLIEKGANLFYDNENILHIILKKKFKKIGKKKKFLKELAGRINLVQPDIKGFLPLQYEENQQIKALCAELFKPKLLPIKIQKEKDNNSKSKSKDLKELSYKEVDSHGKEAKKKTKDLDISFSEVDDEDYQDQKNEVVQQTKLTEVIEIPEEESPILQLKGQLVNQKKNKENKMKKSNSSEIKLIYGKEKEDQKQFENSCEVGVDLIQKNSICFGSTIGKIIEDEKEKDKKTKLNNSLILIGHKQNLTVSQNSSFHGKNQNNRKITKKQSQEDLIKNNIKRKNSSFLEEDSPIIKVQKVKGNGKKCQIINIRKEALEEEQKELQWEREKKEKEKEKERRKEEKLIEAKIKELEEQEKKVLACFEKIDKESQTDSEESYQGDIACLTEQIFALANKISNMNKEKEPMVKQIIDYIETSIRHELEHDCKNFRLDIFVYGSQSTGLAVQHSDVDLLLVSNFDCLYLMRLLEDKRVLDLADICSAKYITSAAMPVVKIVMSKKYNNMSVDLTFQTRTHMGLKCSETIQSYMAAEPLLRPLVLIIKTLTHVYGLSDPYKGGIGSYGITLMVIALLQSTEKEKKKEDDIGHLLINFFYFYGIEMDYICQAIIVHELGYAHQTLFSIYRLPYLTDLNPKLIIYDPLNPVNNVGRTTYRISALKKLFSICYFRLKGNPPCKLMEILDGSFLELLDQY